MKLTEYYGMKIDGGFQFPKDDVVRCMEDLTQDQQAKLAVLLLADKKGPQEPIAVEGVGVIRYTGYHYKYIFAFAEQES